MSETFADDFESGSLVTNWPTRQGAVSAVAAAAYDGSFGARVAPNGGNAHMATSTTKWTQGTYSWARLVFRLRINAYAASGTTDITFIQNQIQTNNFDLFISTPPRVFRINLTHQGAGGPGALDLIAPELDRWYLVQCKVFYGGTTYTAQVKIDGQVFDVLADPDETASFIRSLHFGITTATTYSIDIDDVDLLVDTVEPAFLDASVDAAIAHGLRVTHAAAAASTVGVVAAHGLTVSHDADVSVASAVVVSHGLRVGHVADVAAGVTVDGGGGVVVGHSGELASAVGVSVTHGVAVGHIAVAVVAVTADADHGLAAGHAAVTRVAATASVAHGVALTHSAVVGDHVDVAIGHGLTVGHAVAVTIAVDAEAAHGVQLGHAANVLNGDPVFAAAHTGIVLGHAAAAAVIVRAAAADGIALTHHATAVAAVTVAVAHGIQLAVAAQVKIGAATITPTVARGCHPLAAVAPGRT